MDGCHKAWWVGQRHRQFIIIRVPFDGTLFVLSLCTPYGCLFSHNFLPLNCQTAFLTHTETEFTVAFVPFETIIEEVVSALGAVWCLPLAFVHLVSNLAPTMRAMQLTAQDSPWFMSSGVHSSLQCPHAAGRATTRLCTPHPHTQTTRRSFTT